MKNLIISTLILLSSQSFACDKPVTYLLSGDTAPCSGYLFSPKKELEVREKIVELKYTKEIVLEQQKVIALIIERLQDHQNDLSSANKEIESFKKYEPYKIGGSFLLGIILTSIIVNVSK
jgi:hypothetical protein